MGLKKIQEARKQFEEDRNWDNSLASNVFVHLIEELGEIGRYINFEERYKDEKLGSHPNITKSELKKVYNEMLLATRSRYELSRNDKE